ncbi:hypothetical protein B0T20DRAFT_417230 [Sordaria brevicollis]|uniref:Secreted protein n=1 Tax=Sordaria brevicollis TaxID=83679 RepID=A0AAE0U9T7_SORBR|nr:hypothetical protein B0T20DRAFT_417230 [Sordaria brevicollis]
MLAGCCRLQCLLAAPLLHLSSARISSYTCATRKLRDTRDHGLFLPRRMCSTYLFMKFFPIAGDLWKISKEARLKELRF